MKKYYIILAVIIIVAGAWIWYNQNYQTSQKENGQNQNELINKVSYKCDSGKTINASYYKGVPAPQPQPGEMPIPTGSVALILSDGRQMTLPQTISASGIRYTNADESLIFWSKGEIAFIMENNQQTYAECIDAIYEYKNSTYKIGNMNVALVNGFSEIEIIPGSASKITTRYFGNEAFDDLNGDGLMDVVFLLTQDGGGSGTFYYAAAAIKTPAGYQGANAVFIGERIAPQTTEIKNGEIIINYADRKPGEPMTAQPSVGVSKYLKVENGTLIVEQK